MKNSALLLGILFLLCHLEAGAQTLCDNLPCNTSPTTNGGILVAPSFTSPEISSLNLATGNWECNKFQIFGPLPGVSGASGRLFIPTGSADEMQVFINAISQPASEYNGVSANASHPGLMCCGLSNLNQVATLFPGITDPYVQSFNYTADGMFADAYHPTNALLRNLPGIPSSVFINSISPCTSGPSIAISSVPAPLPQFGVVNPPATSVPAPTTATTLPPQPSNPTVDSSLIAASPADPIPNSSYSGNSIEGGSGEADGGDSE